MKVILVQFDPYHAQVLAPQIQFLLPAADVWVAAPQNMFSDDFLAPLAGQINKLPFQAWSKNKASEKSVLQKIKSTFGKYFSLYKTIKNNNIDIVVFNTVSQPYHYLLIGIFLAGEKKFQIIHNGQHYRSRLSRIPLKLFKKCLFISKDVHHYFSEHVLESSYRNDFDWFLPGYWNICDDLLADKKDETIRIVIPGSVNYRRRNYRGLLTALQKFRPYQDKPPFEVIFLGKSSQKYQRKIESMGLSNVIKIYTSYVPGCEMLSEVKNADAIAFLIDKKIGKNIKFYNKYKASGTSAFCLTFGKPCIVSSEFNIDSGLKDRSIVYNSDQIESVFEDIIEGKITKADFNRMRRKPLPEAFSFEAQKERYRNLLGIER